MRLYKSKDNFSSYIIFVKDHYYIIKTGYDEMSFKLEGTSFVVIFSILRKIVI